MQIRSPDTQAMAWHHCINASGQMILSGFDATAFATIWKRAVAAGLRAGAVRATGAS
jgi:hypothetical protein